MAKYYSYHKIVDGKDFYSLVLAVDYKDAKKWTKAKTLYTLRIEDGYFEIPGSKALYEAIFRIAKNGERNFSLNANRDVLFGKDKKVLARFDDKSFKYEIEAAQEQDQ